MVNWIYGQIPLYNLIELSQSGDRDALLEVINKFKPLIMKLSRKLSYEESETDLIILFIQMVQSLKLNKFANVSEGALVNYLFIFFKNKSVDLFRKFVLKKPEELELNLDILQYKTDMDTKLFVDELLNLTTLTAHQRLILKKSYISECSDAEIAKTLNISRQAVNRTKNRAIQTIREYLGLWI
ncbi:sigma-70 family RNA polymerase sigma factor [Clostridium sp.]|uniref:RNA polymerase sigma factor n=1 Tax=Clostridium sp. TaxID=1506 RepID=UPI003217F31C